MRKRLVVDQSVSRIGKVSFSGECDVLTVVGRGIASGNTENISAQFTGHAGNTTAARDRRVYCAMAYRCDVRVSYS
jgi:hypothetical protein